MTDNCETTRDKLFEFVDKALTESERTQIESHLDQCPECTGQLQEIWNMQRLAMNWQDQQVPSWNRRAAMPDRPRALGLWQWSASFATAVMLVLVVSQASLSTENGFTLRFGGDNVTQSQLEQRLARLETRQANQLESGLARLTAQQVQTNQLLLRTMLETSRREREADLANVMNLLEQERGQANTSTRDSLNYLIASQLRDRREIRALHAALKNTEDTRDF